jgi:hypothetical protein
MMSFVLSYGLAAIAAARPVVPTGFHCGAGEIRGVAQGDAQTAVEVVCEAIRRRPGATGTYAISVRSLGRQIVLGVTREDEGTSISLQLEAIEEVSAAAARVAEALVAGRPLETTQRVDNLLESETRTPLAKKGSVRFAIGVSGFSPLGHGGSGAGFSLGLTYAAPTVALPVALRFGSNQTESGGPNASFFALSAGGRRYFSKRDLSPFGGVGLSMLRLSASEGGYHADDRYFDGTRFGVAPYLEGGVEMLRLHRAHLAFTLHVDLPLGSLRSSEYPVYTYDPRSRQERVTQVIAARSRYVVPTTFGVTVTF